MLMAQRLEKAPEGGLVAGAGQGREIADPEVVQKPLRRHYSAQYKLRVLGETDHLPQGAVGAYLRREGLYWSALLRWRKEREEGALEGLGGKKRGRHAQAQPLLRVLAAKEREIARLQRKLEQAEQIIGVQKKLCELFGVEPMSASPSRKS